MDKKPPQRERCSSKERRSHVFPVQDSTLSAEAIAQTVLSRYDLPGGAECRFFRKGISDTYRVNAGEDEYYLKVYRADRRNGTDVGEEVRLLRHLADHGVSVARPVARRDGRYVNRAAAPEGTRYSVLFEAARGAQGEEADHEGARAYGAAVAQVHQCADRMPGPYRRAHLDMRHLVDDNLAAVAPLLRHRQADLALIVRIAEECKCRVGKLLGTSKPEYGICLGDLHGGDVRFDEANVATLFDFESSGCGWRALDMGVYLASCMWMDTTDDAARMRQDKFQAFLQGYGSVRRPSEAELHAAQLGPPIRHIELMGIVLRYTARYEGDHWANDNFIDWHMTWFRHWAGRNLSS